MDRRVFLTSQSSPFEPDTTSTTTNVAVILHALASQSQEHGRDRGLASPNDGDLAAIDFSLDSRIIPAQPATPRYHLNASLMHSPDGALAEDSQRENCQEKVQAEIPATSPPSSVSNAPVRGSGSELFNHHRNNQVSASTANVIGTRTVSFQSPPTIARVHPLSRPSSSMPAGNRQSRRSPSLASQDSFGGPVSQDPVQQYLASTKQFDVPLSELGETPTQEVIHSPTDPSIVLPDASEHKEFLEAAMRKYEAGKASRITSSNHANILVAATPSNSGGSSGASQPNDDGFLFDNRGPEFMGNDSKFEFGGSSSFDKMLARDLTDPPDPTQDSTQVEPVQAYDFVDPAPPPNEDGILTPSLRSSKHHSPPFDWIGPAPTSTVASTHPRSLLRMAHPYRVAKMRYLAGDVEPPPCVATDAETQPSHLEETQPCHVEELTHPNVTSPTRPARLQIRMDSARLRQHQAEKGDDEADDDALDIVPDSEPLRAGSSTQTPSLRRTVAQSPLKKFYQPLSPVSEHGSGDFVPDSPLVEESEADVSLVELASRSMKKPVEPVEEMAVHGRNTRTAIPKKVLAPAVEKQPRKPSSSSTKGKNPKVKASKTEPTEIPTSLPDQDLDEQALSSRQLPVSTVRKSSSRKKRGGSPHFAPSRSFPATRPIAGTKRSHKSDTESSEELSHPPAKDEGAVRPRAQKEEEEETESADDYEDSPPPPPLKPETSRKRRRTDDVNASRGVSRSSSSTRNKRSQTPAIVTRSGKRLRSAVSSTRAASADSATRVFALWKQDGHYYAGIVHSRTQKNKYTVRFDDRTEDEVELKNLRCRELLVGDRVISMLDDAKAVVSDVSRVHSHGSFMLEIDDGDDVVTNREVRFRDIRIANRTIQSQWKERGLLAENIIPLVRPKPLVEATPSRQSVISMNSGEVQRELVKTGFVVTISPKNENPLQVKEEVMRAIKQHGGLVIEDWSNVFTMEGKHSQSNKRWTAVPDDFHWKSEVNLNRVFLLSDDAHQKPKFLLALALGIPCISFDWLSKGGTISSDWQPFLLPAGYSDPLYARISQFVDLDWGNCTEHVTDIMGNNVPIKLFSQKKVLCIGADLVPLPPTKKNVSEEASRYVPWIILCMGAAKVEAVTDTKQVTVNDMEKFDYIIVKERSALGPINLDGKVVVGDVAWVKQCLVSLRLFTPELE